MSNGSSSLSTMHLVLHLFMEEDMKFDELGLTGIICCNSISANDDGTIKKKF